MTDRVAISDLVACRYMYEAGLSPEQVQKGLATIKQPCKGMGYYYPSHVIKYIKTINPKYSQL